MFKFRLQRVLELRLQSEQNAATRLASARSGEEAARQACAEVESARDEGLRRASSAPGEQPSVGQLQNLRYLVERLSEQVELAQRNADAAAADVRARMEEFSAAFRDRRILDRLREKELDSFRAEEVQADRKLMDDIALSRFVRSRPGPPEQEAET